MPECNNLNMNMLPMNKVILLCESFYYHKLEFINHNQQQNTEHALQFVFRLPSGHSSGSSSPLNGAGWIRMSYTWCCRRMSLAPYHHLRSHCMLPVPIIYFRVSTYAVIKHPAGKLFLYGKLLIQPQ